MKHGTESGVTICIYFEENMEVEVWDISVIRLILITAINLMRI